MDDIDAIELIQPSPPPYPVPETQAVAAEEPAAETAEYPESNLPYDSGTQLDLFA